jgi:hypothetical protein
MSRKQSMPNEDRLRAFAAVDHYFNYIAERRIANVLASGSLVARETNGMAKHRCDIEAAHRKLLDLIGRLRFELETWPST